MAISDNKITNAEIAEAHVQAAPDTLTGSAQQNKAVFDAYSDLIAGKFNDLIDEIVGPHGDEIKVAVDEWLAEHPEATTTVQDNSLTTAKYVDGSVTPAKLDRTYTTPNDLASVNANLTNELNVLDARMDEFASLPEGSTSGNAELLDIRVGVDGTTYDNAGNAVRGQINCLKNDVTATKSIITETFAATGASGTKVFIMEHPVPANTEFSLTNNSTDTTYRTILIDVDRGVHNIGETAIGETKTVSFDKQIVEFRAYVLSGSTINTLMAYGDNLVERVEALETDTSDITADQTVNGWTSVGAWENRSYDTGTGTWSASAVTLSTANALTANANLIITCKENYKFAVRRWSGTTRESSTFLSDTGWTQSGTVISVSEGEIFDIAMRLVNEANISTTEGSNIRTYVDAENIVNYSYSVNGLPINVDIQKYNASVINNIRSTPASQVTPSVTEVQGMTIYDGTVFQLYSNDVLFLIDFSTNAKTQLSIKSDHGDTIDFSNEFYSASDEFPLAYITADSNPAKVYVNRITRSATELIRTLIFPLDRTGYYAGHALDAVHGILYQVGYSQNSYNTETNNSLVVSSWNINNLTDNGDDTYTPEFLDSFEVPYYSTLQGQAFFDGKIVAVSSPGRNNVPTRVIFIDPTARQIVTVMDDFPDTIKNVETEAVAFVKDGSKYYMVLKTANVFFYRADFS